MRLAPVITAIVAGLFCVPSLAQSPSPGAPSPGAPSPGAPPAAASPGAPVEIAPGSPAGKPDPVVARVNGREIHLSDLQELAQSMPDEFRGAPPQMLFPILLDQAIDREALVIEARKQGLDKNATVQRQMQAAEDSALQNALVERVVAPQITEAAIRARFDKEVAGKSGEDEVHAEQILLPTKEDAEKAIAALKSGTDFSAVAKQFAAGNGPQTVDDLGFFKKSDMVAEFADAAFALEPGQFSQQPVHSKFGWHVIKVLEKRRAPPPSFTQVHDELRQRMVREAVQKVIEQARTGLTVERFNPDGAPVRPTDNAEPPAAPQGH